ncbi:MAG: hypothetical protein AAGI45_15015 [Cyanobacteria bacterium P01_H01_bin.26]
MKFLSSRTCRPGSLLKPLVLALLGLSSLGFAVKSASASWQPETLRNISQLQVQVEKECRVGASEERLKTGIENYLSRNGIPINTSPSTTGMQPYLYVAIECSSRSDSFAYVVASRVYQLVNLNGTSIEAATYSVSGAFGTANVSGYAGGESDIIVEILNDFIADWHSVR